MEPKTARITVLIDPGKKLALEQLCAEQDVTPSQVVRRLIRDYLALNGAAAGASQGEQQPARLA
jgi:hypothetical protein